MTKKVKEANKHEIGTMLSQIEKNDNIAIFNAQKACFVYVDSQELIDKITEWLKEKK